MSHSNTNLTGNSHVKSKGQLIQFSPYSTELTKQLEDDVERSIYKTKTKYLNALMVKVLSLERRFNSRSCIDELFRILDLVADLPIEHIQRLAPARHRNFDQMLMHLLQTSLSDYPDVVSLDLSVPRQRATPEKNTVSKKTLNNN